MTANPDKIVAQARQKLEHLIEITQHNHAVASMYQMEEIILTNVLEIGRLALESFRVRQSSRHKHKKSRHPSGTRLPYHSERTGMQRTIFGPIRFSRSYYRGNGTGHCKMDAVLDLPPVGPSDYLRVLMERLCLSMSYEEAAKLTAEYFPAAQSTRCIQELVETHMRNPVQSDHSFRSNPITLSIETDHGFQSIRSPFPVKPITA